LDHQSRGSEEGRMVSTMFGQKAELKVEMFQSALALAK
jgi:hypothetical protein